MNFHDKITKLEAAQTAAEQDAEAARVSAAAHQAAIDAAAQEMVTPSDPTDEVVDVGVARDHPTKPITYTKIGNDLVALKRLG